jgi:hypothetical protein
MTDVDLHTDPILDMLQCAWSFRSSDDDTILPLFEEMYACKDPVKLRRLKDVVHAKLRAVGCGLIPIEGVLPDGTISICQWPAEMPLPPAGHIVAVIDGNFIFTPLQ